MKNLELSEADAKALAKLLAEQWAPARCWLAADRPHTLNNPFGSLGQRIAAQRRKAAAAKVKLLSKVLTKLGYTLPEPNVEYYAPALTEIQKKVDYLRGLKWNYIPKRSQEEQHRLVKAMGL